MKPGIAYLRFSSRSSRNLKHASMRYMPTHEFTDVIFYHHLVSKGGLMMHGSVILSGFLFFGLLCVRTPVLALQSGGVEIGDLETGSVTGQPFKRLDVDLSFTAMQIAGKNVW